MQMTLLVTFRQMKKTKDLAKFILTFEFSQLMMNLKYLTWKAGIEVQVHLRRFPLKIVDQV